ncbi:MAG: hypothetical protein PCFJNLEI_02571 [Verrucomicrobiae bacterium]|nr:hypothetical protein [Verrucomicrobiae bacterium]
MKTTKGFSGHLTRWIALGLSIVMTLPPVVIGAEQAPTDPGWPRVFKQGRAQLTVYQLQLVEWPGFTNATIRCAIALIPSSDTKEIYGVLEVNTDTSVDQAARTVTTVNAQRQIRFPNLAEAEASKMALIVNNLLPEKRPLIISLDRMLAYLETAQAKPRTTEVNLDPPKIFYSRQPAILVLFMGKPQFKPVATNDTTLLFAANTNWDVFYDTTTGRYFLLNGESWLTSDDPIKGSWVPAKDLPKQLRNLPADDNWADVRKHIPGKPAKQAPVVFVTTEPSEMIVTEGEPAFLPLKGTKLLQVSNTDSTLFLHSAEGQFYFLVAGRWFRTKTLDGPWSAASTDLPADFANIDPDSPVGFVKATVPGTREAQDAVLLASIPRTTTIEVSKPPVVQVVYEGQPQFVVIQGTTVQYAVNTPNQVFLVNGAYYCCNQGVWFYAAAPTGPWLLATSVPAAIYTIPPSNPNYNVTYVVVQQSTPTTVVYSQTSGYSGEYVAATGVLMFGMGMLVGAAIADDHHYHDYYWHYPPRPCHYSYGCGAAYHHGYGGYYASAHVSYGPYGGAGRTAAYNPHTGTYSRGAYAYGPAGSKGVRQAYNPYTGGYAQQGRVNTRYGSAGGFYAEQDGEWAQGGYRSGSRGAVGGIRTSEDSGMKAWDTKYGQGMVAKDKEGNIYVGHDGEVYKRNEEGEWKTYEDGDWKKAETPSAGQPRAQSTSTRETGSRSTPTATSTGTRAAPTSYDSKSVQQGLERDAEARSWGNTQAKQTSSYKSSGNLGGRSSGGSRRR